MLHESNSVAVRSPVPERVAGKGPLLSARESFAARASLRQLHGMSKLLGLAAFLLVLWVILWVALKITGVVLHLLWIFAIVLFVIWLIGKIRGNK